MLSKAKIKLISSLGIKKYREEHGLFIAEGNKICQEVLKAKIPVNSIYASSDWLEKNAGYSSGIESFEVSGHEMKKISQLSTPQEVLLLIDIPLEPWSLTRRKSPIIVLDGIRDPGNLGTILRLGDWFGFQKLILSKDSVDLFNPKVIQSSMGSFLRIDWEYHELPAYFSKLDTGRVYGTYMDGKSIFKEKLTNATHFVLGNEGQGISEEVQAHIHRRISIPSHPFSITESLNVASAAGILYSEIFRQGG